MSKGPPDLAAIAASLQQQRLPPVHKWNPEVCGEIDMRIARDGRWFYQGSPIGRQRMVKLFSTVLRHDPDGAYYLVTPVEKLRITVEDAPFLAVEMTVHGSGEDQVLVFRTNVDEEVIAGPEHPVRVETDPRSGEPSPYLLVRDRLEALIHRPVFYDMVALAETVPAPEGARLQVWSAGACFSLGTVPEAP